MFSFDFDYTAGLFPLLLKYLEVTMTMSIISLVIALSLAVVLAVIKTYNIKGLSTLCDIYISFFRGTPLLVQLFLLYYGLPQVIPFFKYMDAYTASIIGLSLHFSAYMAEAIRGAILSVDKGQFEASSSLGLNRNQSLRYIILPQASRIALPSLMNNYIDLLKSTSLAFTLGVAEIMAKAQLEAASSFKYFESYLAVALIYWAVVVFFTFLQKRLEIYLNKAYES